jgi:hypothetical protein
LNSSLADSRSGRQVARLRQKSLDAVSSLCILAAQNPAALSPVSACCHQTLIFLIFRLRLPMRFFYRDNMNDPVT